MYISMITTMQEESMDYPGLFTAFQEAHNLLLDDEISGLEYHNLGNLAVTSGKLLACDPYYCAETEPFAAELIPAGQYPVIVSIASIRKRDRRVAFAAIVIQDTLPVNWKIAVPLERDIAGRKSYTYCVDSGIGCFMDVDAVSAFARVCEEYDPETDPILKAMENNESQLSVSWANVCVNQDTGTNIIAFPSGWGDGGYPSYFGYDENEHIVCLVTDFGVLGESCDKI